MCTGKMQTAAFLDEKAEDVILERAVFLFAGNASAHVALVKFLGLRAAGIAKGGGAEIGDLELHGDAASLGIVFQHLADEFQIVAEGGGEFA